MVKWTIPPVLLLIASLSNTAGMQEPPTPWRDDPAFQRLAKALDGVLAIDTHTHLLRTGKFNPAIAERTPLLNRSTHPWYPAIVKARFGLDVDRRDWAKGDAAIDAARSEMIKRLGDHGYWMDHLDYTRTEIALVNENSRTADVPQAQAADLYAKGVKAPLARDEYLALQDFLWRHILLEAGRITLPVHIHSSLGVPPFLRSLESDVRNLEDVLTDVRFFKTPIVLIHGGGPWYDIAAYLALKPNVWIDVSSIGFLYSVPDFADILRKYFLLAPEKVLFGTDAASYPSVPGGADVQHLMLSRATRDALYLALAGLVRDGVIEETRAIDLGRGVLRDNARRLYGWK